MAAKKLPWFRLYTEMVDDEKLRLLAFEDRWHYVALLCLKGSGLLDEECAEGLKRRRIAVKLGLSVREVEEVGRRLAEVGLVDEASLLPCGWAGRQFKSDCDETSAERQRRYRERQAGCNALPGALVTPPESDSDSESEPDKTRVVEKNDRAVAVALLLRKQGIYATPALLRRSDFAAALAQPDDNWLAAAEEAKRRKPDSRISCAYLRPMVEDYGRHAPVRDSPASEKFQTHFDRTADRKLAEASLARQLAGTSHLCDTGHDDFVSLLSICQRRLHEISER